MYVDQVEFSCAGFSSAHFAGEVNMRGSEVLRGFMDLIPEMSFDRMLLGANRAPALDDAYSARSRCGDIAGNTFCVLR
jgi:hypothetical protein